MSANIEIPNESEYFTNAVRAHLTTTNTKPCSYFATTAYGPVFVKGPYRDMLQANVQRQVTRFKAAVAPDLPRLGMNVMEMKFERDFLNCQYGLRTRLTQETGFFLLCEDLIQPRHDGPLPTKERSSKKAWPVSVDVVDMDALAGVAHHPRYAKKYSESLFATEKESAAIELVLHVLLSWACGCGADLAMSNFMFVDGKCYQLDLEAWGRFDWNISNTPIGSVRTKANAHMCEFLYENWVVIEPKLAQIAENWKNQSADDWDFHAEISERISQLTTYESVISVVQCAEHAKESGKTAKAARVYTM